MISTQSLHNHCTFDDGKHTPAEMVRAAHDAGLSGFGLTAHSPMDGEPGTVAPERMEPFRAEMARLRAPHRFSFLGTARPHSQNRLAKPPLLLVSSPTEC